MVDSSKMIWHTVVFSHLSTTPQSLHVGQGRSYRPWPQCPTNTSKCLCTTVGFKQSKCHWNMHSYIWASGIMLIFLGTAAQADQEVQYSIYGDGLYVSDSHTRSRCKGILTKMSISNECDYMSTSSLFPFVKHKEHNCLM